MPRTNVVGATPPSGSGAQRCAQAGEREHIADSTARPAIATATGARRRRRPEDAIHEGRVFGLELKAEGGRATPKQQEAIAAMEAAGAFTAIAEGLDHATACLEAWGLLVGRRQ